MSMIEIVHLTRQELYERAVAAVKALTFDGPPSDDRQNLLDDISFYLMACPPPEGHKE